MPLRAMLLLGAVLVGSLCLALPALADTTGTTGDLAWSDNGTRVSITSCATATCPATLTIPATIDIGGGVLHPVTRIGDSAFQNQTTLTAVTFTAPSNVTTIGYNAFWSADHLTTLAIPGGVTTIGDGAFGHTHVPTFTIPSGLTTIPVNAFYGADLTSITIPSGITTIGANAFYGAMYLEQFTVDSSNPNFSSDSNGSLFNKTKTTLLNYSYGKTATSYTIPDTVTTLGDDAFNSASHLKRVTVPSSVTTMGWGTFYSTGALTRVEFLGDPPACPLCNEFSFWGNHPTVYRFDSAANWPAIGTPYLGSPQAYLVLPPSAPTAVVNATSATVTVTTPPSTGPVPTSYTVAAVGDPSKTCLITGSTGNCTVSGLANSTAYTFTATATSSSPSATSAASDPSNEITTLAIAPNTPATPTAVAGNGQVTITVANGTGAGGAPASYLVTAVGISPAKVCTVTGASGSCTIAGLANGTSYTFTAAATNTGGTSAASSPSAAVTPQSPPDSSSDRAADNTAATGSDSTPSLTSPSADVRVISSRASKTAVIVTLNVSAPGTVVVTARGSIRGGSRAAKQLSVCKTTKTVTAAATVKVVCPFTKAARSALRSHAVNATVTTIFTPTGSAAQTASTQLMLRRR